MYPRNVACFRYIIVNTTPEDGTKDNNDKHVVSLLLESDEDGTAAKFLALRSQMSAFFGISSCFVIILSVT